MSYTFNQEFANLFKQITSSPSHFVNPVLQDVWQYQHGRLLDHLVPVSINNLVFYCRYAFQQSPGSTFAQTPQATDHIILTTHFPAVEFTAQPLVMIMIGRLGWIRSVTFVDHLCLNCGTFSFWFVDCTLCRQIQCWTIQQQQQLQQAQLQLQQQQGKQQEQQQKPLVFQKKTVYHQQYQQEQHQQQHQHHQQQWDPHQEEHQEEQQEEQQSGSHQELPPPCLENSVDTKHFVYSMNDFPELV